MTDPASGSIQLSRRRQSREGRHGEPGAELRFRRISEHRATVQTARRPPRARALDRHVDRQDEERSRPPLEGPAARSHRRERHRRPRPKAPEHHGGRHLDPGVEAEAGERDRGGDDPKVTAMSPSMTLKPMVTPRGRWRAAPHRPVTAGRALRVVWIRAGSSRSRSACPSHRRRCRTSPAGGGWRSGSLR